MRPFRHHYNSSRRQLPDRWAADPAKLFLSEQNLCGALRTGRAVAADGRLKGKKSVGAMKSKVTVALNLDLTDRR